MRYSILMVLAILVSGSPSPAADYCDLGCLLPDEIFAAPCDSCCYVQGSLLTAFPHLQARGVDVLSENEIAGSDSDASLGVGAAIGVMHCFETFRLRTEMSGNWLGHSDFVTSSGPIDYKVNANQWSTMANIWFDKPLTDEMWIYAGGGLGTVRTSIHVQNGAITGKGSTKDFTYQVGTGLIFPVQDNMEFDLGYRFVDAGSVTAKLTGGGSYTTTMNSHLIMLSLRWCFR